MKKNIRPVNEDGARHGYWEDYYYDGKLMYKGTYVNGKIVGYWYNKQIWYKGYYNNGKLVGYWEEYNWDKEIQIYI